MSTARTPQQRLADLLNSAPPDPPDPSTWRHWPLEDYQQLPAHRDPGPVLILGGAGTGKTHTLLGRAVHLARSGADPGSMVIIAPSAWAAQDMRVRLFPVIGRDPADIDLYVGTLHDYCLTRFLRPYAVSLPTLPQHFSMWTRGRSLAALAQIIDSDSQNRNARRRHADPAPILDWITANAQLGPGQRAPAPRDEWERYAAAYRREKAAQDSLDHTDLLVATRDTLLENTALRDYCASLLTRHLLVDNFEDVSPLQYQLIRLMSGPEESVCVAMDPNQSVGRWISGAETLIDQFMTDYTGATGHTILINHRTSASIMASWRGLARHSAMTALVDDLQRELRPQNRRPSAIAVDGTPQDQYRRIANDVRRLVDEGTFEPDQIAVLARRRQSLLRLRPHLEAAGVPSTAIGDFLGTGDREVQPALAMLTLAVNPKNDWAFLKAGNRAPDPFHRDLNARIVREVRSAARRLDIDLVAAASHVRADLPAGSIAHEDLSGIIDLYHELQGMMADGDSGVAAMLELVHHQIHGADRTSPPDSDDLTRLMTWARDCDHTALARAVLSTDRGEDPAPVNVRSALMDFLDRMAGGHRYSTVAGGGRGNSGAQSVLQRVAASRPAGRFAGNHWHGAGNGVAGGVGRRCRGPHHTRPRRR